MRLFHGSSVEIQEVNLSKSKKGKDFGKGFYLSEDYQHALSIARNRSLLTRTDPVVNTFEFDENALHSPDLRFLHFEGYTLEWSEFVLANRRNRADTNLHDYDIVYGPVANDTVGVQIQKYLDGYLTQEQFLNEIKYMKGITFQYFFGTEHALRYLRKI